MCNNYIFSCRLYILYCLLHILVWFSLHTTTHLFWRWWVKFYVVQYCWVSCSSCAVCTGSHRLQHWYTYFYLLCVQTLDDVGLLTWAVYLYGIISWSVGMALLLTNILLIIWNQKKQGQLNRIIMWWIAHFLYCQRDWMFMSNKKVICCILLF